ncbi:MAG: right-handed parallel beta-helix repeat-containing protein [bacterium]
MNKNLSNKIKVLVGNKKDVIFFLVFFQMVFLLSLISVSYATPPVKVIRVLIETGANEEKVINKVIDEDGHERKPLITQEDGQGILEYGLAIAKDELIAGLKKLANISDAYYQVIVEVPPETYKGHVEFEMIDIEDIQEINTTKNGFIKETEYDEVTGDIKEYTALGQIELKANSSSVDQFIILPKDTDYQEETIKIYQPSLKNSRNDFSHTVERIRITGFTIEGKNDSVNSISAEGTAVLIVSNCRIINSYNGILGKSGVELYSEQNIISGNNCGISLSDGSDAFITHNFIDDNIEIQIEIYDSNAEINNSTILLQNSEGIFHDLSSNLTIKESIVCGNETDENNALIPNKVNDDGVTIINSEIGGRRFRFRLNASSGFPFEEKGRGVYSGTASEADIVKEMLKKISTPIKRLRESLQPSETTNPETNNTQSFDVVKNIQLNDSSGTIDSQILREKRTGEFYLKVGDNDDNPSRISQGSPSEGYTFLTGFYDDDDQYKRLFVDTKGNYYADSCEDIPNTELPMSKAGAPTKNYKIFRDSQNTLHVQVDNQVMDSVISEFPPKGAIVLTDYSINNKKTRFFLDSNGNYYADSCEDIPNSSFDVSLVDGSTPDCKIVRGSDGKLYAQIGDLVTEQLTQSPSGATTSFLGEILNNNQREDIVLCDGKLCLNNSSNSASGLTNLTTTQQPYNYTGTGGCGLGNTSLLGQQSGLSGNAYGSSTYGSSLYGSTSGYGGTNNGLLGQQYSGLSGYGSTNGLSSYGSSGGLGQYPSQYGGSSSLYSGSSGYGSGLYGGLGGNYPYSNQYQQLTATDFSGNRIDLFVDNQGQYFNSNGQSINLFTDNQGNTYLPDSSSSNGYKQIFLNNQFNNQQGYPTGLGYQNSSFNQPSTFTGPLSLFFKSPFSPGAQSLNPFASLINAQTAGLGTSQTPALTPQPVTQATTQPVTSPSPVSNLDLLLFEPTNAQTPISGIAALFFQWPDGTVGTYGSSDGTPTAYLNSILGEWRTPTVQAGGDFFTAIIQDIQYVQDNAYDLANAGVNPSLEATTDTTTTIDPPNTASSYIGSGSNILPAVLPGSSSLSLTSSQSTSNYVMGNQCKLGNSSDSQDEHDEDVNNSQKCRYRYAPAVSAVNPNVQPQPAAVGLPVVSATIDITTPVVTNTTPDDPNGQVSTAASFNQSQTYSSVILGTGTVLPNYDPLGVLSPVTRGDQSSYNAFDIGGGLKVALPATVIQGSVQASPSVVGYPPYGPMVNVSRGYQGTSSVMPGSRPVGMPVGGGVGNRNIIPMNGPALRTGGNQ